MVVSTIATVIAAIPATFVILDRWQRPASAPPTVPEPRPAIEGEAPKTAPQGADASIPESSIPAATEGREPNRQAPEPGASRVESLINRQAISPGSVPMMAIALDGDLKDVELMEAALAQGVSSTELRLVSGFFKPAFRKRGFLRAVYDGDTDVLTSSGALASVERVLIGRIERACRATGQIDSDLVTCDVGLYFKVFDKHGAIANSGHVTVAGAGGFASH